MRFTTIEYEATWSSLGVLEKSSVWLDPSTGEELRLEVVTAVGTFRRLLAEIWSVVEWC